MASLCDRYFASLRSSRILLFEVAYFLRKYMGFDKGSGSVFVRFLSKCSDDLELLECTLKGGVRTSLLLSLSRGVPICFVIVLIDILR
jgi:hypothetical protein